MTEKLTIGEECQHGKLQAVSAAGRCKTGTSSGTAAMTARMKSRYSFPGSIGFVRKAAYPWENTLANDSEKKEKAGKPVCLPAFLMKRIRFVLRTGNALPVLPGKRCKKTETVIFYSFRKNNAFRIVVGKFGCTANISAKLNEIHKKPRQFLTGLFAEKTGGILIYRLNLYERRDIMICNNGVGICISAIPFMCEPVTVPAYLPGCAAIVSSYPSIF